MCRDNIETIKYRCGCTQNHDHRIRCKANLVSPVYWEALDSAVLAFTLPGTFHSDDFCPTHSAILTTVCVSRFLRKLHLDSNPQWKSTHHVVMLILQQLEETPKCQKMLSQFLAIGARMRRIFDEQARIGMLGDVGTGWSESAVQGREPEGAEDEPLTRLPRLVLEAENYQLGRLAFNSPMEGMDLVAPFAKPWLSMQNVALQFRNNPHLLYTKFRGKDTQDDLGACYRLLDANDRERLRVGEVDVNYLQVLHNKHKLRRRRDTYGLDIDLSGYLSDLYNTGSSTDPPVCTPCASEDDTD